jgi:signal transduction histidine kinase
MGARGKARPVGARDIAVAAVVSVLGLALMLANVSDSEVDASPLAMPLFLLVTVPLVWRRAAPLAMLCAAVAALLLHVALFGELVRCGIAFTVAFLLAFAVAERLELRPAIAGLGLALVIVVATSLSDPAVDAAALPFFAPLTAAVWGIGRVVRSRSRLAAELGRRTAELREARNERARLEVASDRARLSRELDELLQRRLGELARIAEGPRPRDPAASAAALLEVERRSRDTLEEMRAIVGVLREDSPEPPTAPQPTLTQLEALLVRTKGGNARIAVEGTPRVLPPSVELAAYRVVEHLLAALEDAPGVEVTVRFGDDALELAVSGPARRRARDAIERARERARLQQGTLHATVRGGRAEAAVSLPVLTAA